MSRRAPGLSAAAFVVVALAALPGLAWGQAQPPAPPRAEPDVTLTLSAPTTRGTWTVRVTNDGDVPVRIAADARMLALDVTARGARAPVRCELPDDMRPEGDLERPLVLPPGRSYSESFEARLYCFGDKKASALAPGSIVIAHLGWMAKRPTSFVVSPIDGVEPRATPRGALDAAPIVLPDEPTARPTPATPDSAGGDADDTPLMSLRSGAWVDADSASALEVPVTLRNDGTHAVVVRFRPEVLRFDLVGPDGVDHCTWPVPFGAPTREQFTTLAPRSTSQLTAALTAYCGSHAFDPSGLFFVRARVDTRKTSGALIGVQAFEGELVASSPAVVRLHRGRAPKPLPRPKVEEQ